MAFVSSGFSGLSLKQSTCRFSSRCKLKHTNLQMSVQPEHEVSRRRILSAGAVSAVAAILGAGRPALADHTQVAAKVSYDRYFPRIEAGMDEVRAIRAAIKSGDLESAKKLISERTFSVKFRRALSIFATSFSDSSVNQRSRQLLTYVDGFYDNITAASEANSKDQAVEKFNKAASALEAYVRIARLTRLNSVDLAI